MNKPKATVYIIDDDQAICESLQWLIESVELNVKTYSSAKAFIDDYESSFHGCILLDVRMPEMSGIELQKQLRDQAIALPIIFITGHGDIPMAVRAMKAGAIDFLTKPFNDQDLLDSLHKAIEYDEARLQHHVEYKSVLQRIQRLSPRENQVMRLIVDGNPNKIVAEKLGISVKTVELHRARLMDKMELTSLAELVKYALCYSTQRIDVLNHLAEESR